MGQSDDVAILLLLLTVPLVGYTVVTYQSGVALPARERHQPKMWVPVALAIACVSSATLALIHPQGAEAEIAAGNAVLAGLGVAAWVINRRRSIR